MERGFAGIARLRDTRPVSLGTPSQPFTRDSGVSAGAPAQSAVTGPPGTQRPPCTWAASPPGLHSLQFSVLCKHLEIPGYGAIRLAPHRNLCDVSTIPVASSLLEKEDESSLASASSPLTGVWRWGLFKLPRPHCLLKGANKSCRHTHVLGGRSSHRGAWLGLAPATTPPQLPPKAEWGEGGGRVAPPAFAEAFGLVFGCHSPWGRLHPTREL